MSEGDKIGKTKIGKGVSTWQNSKPLAVSVTSAQLHEITLLQEINPEDVPSTMTPQKIIGDKAYDSDPHDTLLTEKGIELIVKNLKLKTDKKSEDTKNDGASSVSLPG